MDDFFSDLIDETKTLIGTFEDPANILKANDSINRALKISPKNPDAWALKSQIHSALEDDFSAYAAIQEALYHSPNRSDLLYIKAAILGDLDFFNEAEDIINLAFSRTSKEDLIREDLFYEKALLLGAQGKNDESSQTIKQGLDEFPDSELLKSQIRSNIENSDRPRFRLIKGGRND